MFDEIFWFYCSSDSDDIDRYAKFNYLEGTWDIGSLSRTAWVDFGLHTKPRAAGAVNSSNYIYDHESGTTNDGSAMTSYIESSVFDIGDGNQFVAIKKIIPDIDISSAAGNGVDYILKTRNYPGESLTTNSTSSVTSTTTKSDIRARSRSAVLRIQSSADDISWTLGDTRMEIQPDGRR